MPFDGNGNWTSNFSAVADRDANIKILASRFDSILLADIAQSFENCLTKDTQVKPQQPFNANNYRVLNVANPVDSKDAVNLQTLETKSAGDKTITGVETFTGQQQPIKIECPWTLGTPPDSKTCRQIQYTDENGTVTGGLEKAYYQDGAIRTQITCRNPDGTNNYEVFGIGYGSDGVGYASASAGVKKSIVEWAMPNYGSGVSKSASTNYTETSNGFLYVSVQRASGSQGTMSLKIGSKTFEIKSNDYSWDSLIFPIARGVTYSYTLSNISNHTVTFYPCYGG